MAYTSDGIKAILKYKSSASEWRWSVEAHGDVAGEVAFDSGVASTHTDALTAMATAITNRLA